MQQNHKCLHNNHTQKEPLHCEAKLAALLFLKQLFLSYPLKPHSTEA